MRSNRLLNAIKSRIGLPPPVVRSSIFGADLKVRQGTFSDHPDYDDGWLYALISQSSVFFDIGSNVGAWSLIACLNYPDRDVVIADANPQALAVAAENLFLNGFSKRIRFLLAFIGKTEDEEVEFYTVGTGAAGSRFRSHAKTAAAVSHSFKVKTTTLDNVAREMQLVPDLIKIDIEGAEAEALIGAKELATKYKSRFFVEMHGQEELSMQENGDKVLMWCRDYNYNAYYLKNHQLVTSSEVFAHRGRCHLYLQPKEIDYPSYLKEIEQSTALEEAHNILLKNNLL